jgi:hypothetical protein
VIQRMPRLALFAKDVSSCVACAAVRCFVFFVLFGMPVLVTTVILAALLDEGEAAKRLEDVMVPMWLFDFLMLFMSCSWGSTIYQEEARFGNRPRAAARAWTAFLMIVLPLVGVPVSTQALLHLKYHNHDSRVRFVHIFVPLEALLVRPACCLPCFVVSVAVVCVGTGLPQTCVGVVMLIMSCVYRGYEAPPELPAEPPHPPVHVTVV